ncbi:glycosyltransferase family 39 protein [Flavobacteriaceae bacterium]|nr:glycosyltransferase family 39 protein [Flavobacteriaceae bacterium]
MRKHFFALFLIGLFFFNFLPYLNSDVKIWDEASYSLNAIELSKGFENLLVNHRNGSLDLYSVKPPFVIFLQAISLKLFGVNEIALRLPNFLIVLINTISIYLIGFKLSKSRLTGLISIFVFLTTNLLFVQHGFFSANLDVTLMFFSSSCQFILFYYLIHEKEKIKINKYLFAFFFSISLGFLSKGVAAFFILPGCIVLVFWKKNILRLLNFKSIIILVGVCVFPLIYYFIADLYYPGYLAKVFSSEIMRSFDKNIGGQHNQPLFYYISSIPYHFNYYIYFSPIFIIFYRHFQNQKLIVYTGITVFMFFLTLSIFEFKAIWYLIPIIPTYSLFIGAISREFINYISKKIKYLSKVIILIITILFLVKPTLNIFEKLNKEVLWYNDVNENEGKFLNFLFQDGKINTNIFVLTKKKYPMTSQLDFYIEKIKSNSIYDVGKISTIPEQKMTNLVICDPIDFKNVFQNYTVSIITNNNQCWFVQACSL